MKPHPHQCTSFSITTSAAGEPRFAANPGVDGSHGTIGVNGDWLRPYTAKKLQPGRYSHRTTRSKFTPVRA